MGFVIGVDAGGSRTRVFVADSDGEIDRDRPSARCRGEARRDRALGGDHRERRAGCARLDPTPRFGAPRALCAGVAGVGRETERRALSEALMTRRSPTRCSW